MPHILLSSRIKINPLLPPLLFLLISSGAPVSAGAAAVIIHEAAHIAAGRFLRLKVGSVTLSPLGADIEYKGVIPYRADIILSLSGPLVSVVSALCAAGFCRAYFSVSLAYGLLNLIPVPCFDGGRALYGVSHLLAPAPAADVICDAVNIFFLLLLYLFSVFILFYTSFNASLLLLCACIFIKSYVKMSVLP